MTTRSPRTKSPRTNSPGISSPGTRATLPARAAPTPRGLARLVARLGEALLGPAARAGQIVADAEARIVGLVPGMPHVRPSLRLVHSADPPRMRHGLGPIVNHARAMSRG